MTFFEIFGVINMENKNNKKGIIKGIKEGTIRGSIIALAFSSFISSCGINGNEKTSGRIGSIIDYPLNTIGYDLNNLREDLLYEKEFLK